MIGSPLRLLAIKPFAHSGMFREPNARWVKEAYWTVRFPAFAGTAQFNPATGALSVVNQWAHLSLNVGWQPANYGHRWHFVCPECCHYRNELVIDHEVKCPECYCFQRDHAFTIRHRKALLEEARQEIDAKMRAAKLVALVQRNVIARPKPSPPPPAEPPLPKRNSWKRRQLTTELAIDRGEGLVQSLIFEEVTAKPSEQWREKVSVRLNSFVAPDKLDLASEYPMLDINALAQKIGFKGGVAASSLRWGQEPDWMYQAAVFLDSRSEDWHVLVAHDMLNADDRKWQRLAVARHPSGRVRIVCPITDKRCDMLFERNGIFASLQAQRLVYPSQRAEGRRDQEWRAAQGVTPRP